jgi:hypothetical protein
MPQPSPLPFKAALQAAIAHHRIMPNNLDLIPILVNFSPQQLITTSTNIPPTMNAPAFADPVGEFFRVLKLEFSIKTSETFLQLATFFWQKDETLKMLYRRLFKFKKDT